MRQRRITLVAIAVLSVLVALSAHALFRMADENGMNAAVQDFLFSGLGGDLPKNDAEADGLGEAEDAAASELYPYYYEAERMARYAAFSALHPELAADEVYWRVDCDLDLPPYENVQTIADPYSVTLLVGKHYCLPEEFSPDDLISVGSTKMRREAGEAMQRMINAASGKGLNIWSQSGYRAYSLQVQLYDEYSARDGRDAADTHSARPGHSEHQTGLTTDLNTITDAFGDTEEGKWVAENCWEFGYIVRYTKENGDVTLYKPEPWHMRYIGLEAAKTMHDEGILSFEEYWVKYVKHTPPEAR